MSLNITTNNTETNPDVLIAAFWTMFPDYAEDERKRFNDAWQFLLKTTGTMKRGCGLPYYLHPLRVAAILAESKLDMECLIAGLFHSLLNVEGVSAEEMKAQFGETVYKIIVDTSKITSWKIHSKTIQQADAIRKMLFAMIDDVRVILVKLADRLDRNPAAAIEFDVEVCWILLVFDWVPDSHHRLFNPRESPTVFVADFEAGGHLRQLPLA